MAVIVQGIESLPEPEREQEIRRLIEEKKEQIATLEEMLPVPRVSVIVNGRTTEIQQKHIHFHEIVNLAFDIPPSNVEGMTVTYRAPSGRRGSMFATMADPVPVEDRMVFNAAFTGNA
jgi:hypothetical protein